MRLAIVMFLAIILLPGLNSRAQPTSPAAQPSSQLLFTETGLPRSRDFFPLAVWLQAPANAPGIRRSASTFMSRSGKAPPNSSLPRWSGATCP